MKRILAAVSVVSALLFLFVCGSARAQTVAPIGALGSIQFLDNAGVPLTNGVLYSYQAGTTTQQATFTDSTGTVQNTNPIAFGSGGRAQVWLTIGQFYKLVLCLQNDGPSCAPADVLFTVDQVPGGSTSSSGGSSPFTGTFISGTASPATSGILRLASADTVCFRNAAGSANLCFSKDGNDLLSWAGGSFKLPEINCPAGVLAFDIICADNTAHRWKMANNGGAAAVVAAQGNDISSSDGVTALHFGATQTPLSSTAPSTGQLLRWDGTNIVGMPLVQVDLTAQQASIAATTLTTPAANGFYRFSCFISITQVATTSSQLPTCTVGFTEVESSVAQTIDASAVNTSNTLGSSGQVPGTAFFQNAGIFAKSGVAITYRTTAYASVGATPMQYAVHIRLEGPF